MDESFDNQPSGIFAVGGILGRGVPVFELERGWEKLLRQHRLRYFKASECQHGTGEFARFVAKHKNKTKQERLRLDSISHEFFGLIGHPVPFDHRNYLCVQGTGIVQSDFYDVIKDQKAKPFLVKVPTDWLTIWQ